jgi:pilus assembly protein Flp/PilA
MTKLMNIARQFRDEEEGAAMIEYSVLIGIITAATIATIVLVGLWVAGAWNVLNTELGPVPT